MSTKTYVGEIRLSPATYRRLGAIVEAWPDKHRVAAPGAKDLPIHYQGVPVYPAKGTPDELVVFFGPEGPTDAAHGVARLLSPTMRDFRSRVAALLRKIEWSREIPGSGVPEFDPEWELCALCEAINPGPHREDCELAALLKECEA